MVCMGYSCNSSWIYSYSSFSFNILYSQISKIKKNNSNLREEIKSMAFSNEVQLNVITKDMEVSRDESDYEFTFR